MCCVGGLVLDVPARFLLSLVGWTLPEARLGQARLYRSGRDAGSVLVLTPAMLVRLACPPLCRGRSGARDGSRGGHCVVGQGGAGGWPGAVSGRGRGSSALVA